jgi:hypothetical protein
MSTHFGSSASTQPPQNPLIEKDNVFQNVDDEIFDESEYVDIHDTAKLRGLDSNSKPSIAKKPLPANFSLSEYAQPIYRNLHKNYAVVNSSKTTMRSIPQANIIAIKTALYKGPLSKWAVSGKNEIMMDLLMVFVDNGTSMKNQRWDELDETNYTHASITGKLKVSECVRVITSNHLGRKYTLRQFCRHYANSVYEVLKDTKHKPALALKFGVPKSYPYLAFDFADAINPDRLGDDEIVVVNNCFSSNVKRALGNGSINTSDSTEYHKGSF